MDPAFISRSNIDKCIKIMSNKIGHKVTPWKMLLFILFSYSSLPHPMFLLLMLIPDSSFSWLFNHIPCIISNLKDFEALQNPVIRNHIIGFCTVNPGNTQYCHSSPAVFHYHFVYHWLIYDCSIESPARKKSFVRLATVSLFRYVHKPVLPLLAYLL